MEKSVFEYTLIDTIKEDIAEYNKKHFYNCLVAYFYNDNKVISLEFNGVEIAFGTPEEINAVIKAMFKLEEIKSMEA